MNKTIENDYQEQLDELKSDIELSNNAMYDLLTFNFPGIPRDKIWEDCKNKTFEVIH